MSRARKAAGLVTAGVANSNKGTGQCRCGGNAQVSGRAGRSGMTSCEWSQGHQKSSESGLWSRSGAIHGSAAAGGPQVAWECEGSVALSS